MKDINIIQSKRGKNEFILVFSPEVRSINKILNEFIGSSNTKQEIIIKMDLINFVGNRSERFVQLKIKNSKVVDSSIIKGIEDNETKEITLDEYSRLSLGYIQKIYPISYRNKILNRKNNAYLPIL